MDWRYWIIGAFVGVAGCGPEAGSPAQTDGGSGGKVESSGNPTVGDTGADSSSGGGRPDPIPTECDGVTFAQSQEAWASLMAEEGDTYYVRVRDRDEGSQGVPLQDGCDRTYTLQVIDGAPAWRSLVVEPFGEPASCPDGWIEDAASLGSHDAPLQPWTMPVHYEACEQEVLSQDPVDNLVVFCTFPDGVLAHCSYFPLECADGCSAGPEGYASGIDFDEVGFGLAP